jgi:hypothetical protein
MVRIPVDCELNNQRHNILSSLNVSHQLLRYLVILKVDFTLKLGFYFIEYS